MGDVSPLGAGAFWSLGSNFMGELYDKLFGGAPFDSEAFPNYKKFSPSARARQFSGPLLQQVASNSVPVALEMHELLRDAHVPSELAYYHREGHAFHEPRHRASAMQQNIAWFDYWLLGKKDPDPKYAERYARWDAMAEEWKKSRKSETAPADSAVGEPSKN
jgi:hypothetical protein